MFELCLINELLITAFYWLALNNASLYDDIVIHNISMAGDHIVPLGCLLIDYSFNLIPFCWRHLASIIFVNLVYMILNYSYYRITGNVIYDPIDWQSALGWSIPPMIAVGMVLTFGFLKCISDRKITRNGHSLFLFAIRGKDIRTLTNPEMLAKERNIFGIENHFIERRKSQALTKSERAISYVHESHRTQT